MRAVSIALEVTSETGGRKAIIRTHLLAGHHCGQLCLTLQGLPEKPQMLHLKITHSPPFSTSQGCSMGVNSQDLGLPGHTHPRAGDSSSSPHPTKEVRAASPPPSPPPAGS